MSASGTKQTADLNTAHNERVADINAAFNGLSDERGVSRAIYSKQ
ncbi:Uncharacterised protein [Yersinia kristensenii]|nr:Uncharacterised protein [Yersinia kristensenii]CNK85258.1 Uncharacterised protein [Yersinia kristensenii]